MADLDPVALQNVREMVSPEEADHLLKEVIDSYLKESPKQIAALQGAIAHQDAVSLMSLAHSLKSSSAALGATRLAQLCANLEALGESGQLLSGTDCISQFDAEHKRVVATLQHIRATLAFTESSL